MFFVMVALLLIVFVNLAIFLFHYQHNHRNFIQASYDVFSNAGHASRQPQRSIDCKGGEFLTNAVRKFSNFTVDLNNSYPRQFDAGLRNFSYEFNHADYKQADFWKEFSGYEALPTRPAQTYRGYISVLHVGQELSQCTRLLLQLCMYATVTHRKVVAPRMRNGEMGMYGLPFGDFFNVSGLNKHLKRFGYSELASEEEFSRNCDNERKRVVVVIHKRPNWRKGPFTLRDKFGTYDKLVEQGWINCSEQVTTLPKPLRKYQMSDIDFYCMHGLVFENYTTFNEKILGDSKCLYISSWVHMYNMSWHEIRPPGVPIAFRLLYWYANPTAEIIKEVNAFTEMRIRKPYVAIHIRGVKFKNKTFLRPCFELALEFVNALRRAHKVKTLFLSTDMSQFGGITNKDHDSHQLFTEMSGAVTYDPEVTKVFKSVDRWKVSLSEVRIMSQADHLITVGQGSFGRFIRHRYLWEHRNRQNWTLSTVCMETTTRFF